MTRPWIEELAELTVRHKKGDHLTSRERRRLRKLTGKMAAHAGRPGMEWRVRGHQKRAKAPRQNEALWDRLKAVEERPILIRGKDPFTGRDLVVGSYFKRMVEQRQKALGSEALQYASKGLWGNADGYALEKLGRFIEQKMTEAVKAALPRAIPGTGRPPDLEVSSSAALEPGPVEE